MKQISSAQEKAIEAQHLTFRYPPLQSKPILHDVSFTVHQGDYIGIIGDNGSGKTTLIKLLLGFETVQQGTLQVFGQEVSRFRDWRKIGYVAQNSFSTVRLIPATVKEVILSQAVGSGLTPEKKHKSLTELCKKLDLSDFVDKRLSDVSGGQRQRAMIARSLLLNPDLLILDEPFAGLDVESQDILNTLLDTYHQEGKTIVLISHDLEMLKQEVDTVFCLDECHPMTRTGVVHIHGHSHKHPKHTHPV